MIHEILQVGKLHCNCSIFGDKESHEAIVIDPGDEIDRILKVLEKHGLKVAAIIITHAHIDHIGGAEKLKTATGAPVYMNAKDQQLYNNLEIQAGWVGMRAPKQTKIDVNISEGNKLTLGDREFLVLETPGHTQGSISVWIPGEQKVVAGDTLFRGSVGRTDLPGGDGYQILRSIHSKLMTLPDATVVVPGHGQTTTIARERMMNPFVRL